MSSSNKKLASMVILMLVLFMSGVYAASKVGTFGVPNSSGKAPLEVDSNRMISVSSDSSINWTDVRQIGTGINWTDNQMTGNDVNWQELKPFVSRGINWIDYVGVSQGKGTAYNVKIKADGTLYLY